MTYFSLFSGIGGFELGIQQAYESNRNRYKADGKRKGSKVLLGRNMPNSERLNVENPVPHCVGYSEIDKYAIQIYQKHFPNHHNYGDITKINAKELPDFDLIVGGFPCQSFSIAGKRGGFEDTRGTLFFEIARIIKVKRPRLLCLENVKGLLSHDGGKTFTTIISALDELGYDLQWQVLNSKNFGVPQNRERVFIVGHLRGTARPQVFPIGEGDQIDDQVREVKDREGARSSCLSTRYGQRWTDETYIGIRQLNNPKHSNDRIYSEEGISPTLNTMQGGRRQPKIQRDTKIRRLTPLECERLQGFPDNWTEGISDTQRYKCCGNAVTVNVIRAIIGKMLE